MTALQLIQRRAELRREIHQIQGVTGWHRVVPWRNKIDANTKEIYAILRKLRQLSPGVVSNLLRAERKVRKLRRELDDAQAQLIDVAGDSWRDHYHDFAWWDHGPLFQPLADEVAR